MKTSGLTFLFFISFIGVSLSQIIPDSKFVPDSDAYLGQTPPGNIRKIFNLATDPGYTAVEKIAISPDGNEIYYEETNSNWTSFKFKYYKYSNNTWNGPLSLFNGYYCLSLSPDGNSMYFENNNYNDGWISNLQNTVWGPPARFLEPFHVHSLNHTSLENYYISSNPPGCLGQRDICKLLIQNSDTSLVSLGLPVNSAANEGDFFIAHDESFMIFMSNRAGGYGITDLYISYKKSDGTFTNPKNLGPGVNTSMDDFGPYVTADNKYLFYESGYAGPSSIYWIRVDGLIDSLKQTNYIPYVKHPIPDQIAVRGQVFNYTVPDSTFIDDDGNNTLTLSAALTSGAPLPSWLSFDPVSSAFSGTPDSLQVLHVKVTATDTAGASVSASFLISVQAPFVIEPLNDKETGVKIFPNPSSGLIYLSTEEHAYKTGVVRISDLEGKVIFSSSFNNPMSIDLKLQPKGVYIVSLQFEQEQMVRKIYLK